MLHLPFKPRQFMNFFQEGQVGVTVHPVYVHEEWARLPPGDGKTPMVLDFWPNEPERTTDIQVTPEALRARTWREGRLWAVVVPWDAISNMVLAREGAFLEFGFRANSESYWDRDYDGLVGEVQKTIRSQQQSLPGFSPTVLDGGRLPWEESVTTSTGHLKLAGATH